MTILFASGEDTGFTFIGGRDSQIHDQRAGFSRDNHSLGVALCVGSNSGAADPPANRFQTPTFTASSTLWVHAQTIQTIASSTLNQQGLIIRSPDNVARIIVRQTATTGGLKISQRNAAGVITDLGTAATVNLSSGTFIAFDLFVDYSVTGGVRLYLNNTQVINYVGDPRTDTAVSQLNQVEFASLAIGSSVTNVQTSWSEIIVADEDTRNMALWTIAPTAPGNTQGWTPNTLGNINSFAIDDSTSITTTVNNTLSEWTVPTTPPSGSWIVRAIVQEARVSTPVTGPQHFDWLARTAGTNYLAGASQAPTPGAPFANFRHHWPLNPNTGAPWQVSEITTTGFNLGIESLA